jgi:hypothetical protein
VRKAGRTSSRRFETYCIALLCWAGAGGAPVLAGQYDFGLGYSLTHDSNITRGSSNPPGCVSPPCAEWTEQLFGGFGYEEHSAELNARVVAQAERRHFVRNVYHDDNGFFLDGAAVWTISPRRFTWTVQDVFREMNTNLTAPDTPLNLVKTNSLSTGPDFTFRVDPANMPVIGARYGRFYIQGPGGDNERYTAYARWLHQISVPTTLSLNFEATRIHFEPPATPTTPTTPTDLFREDLFFSYDLVSLYNRQTVDVGTTRLAQYGGQELNGRLFRYVGQLSQTSQSTLRVFLTDQISDTYSDMIRGVANPTIATIQADAAAAPIGASGTAPGNVYHSRRGELAYLNRGERFGYTLQGYVRRVDYENKNASVQDFDYHEKGGRLSAFWLFSVQAQAYAFTQYMRRTFLSFDEQDADRNRGVGVTYKLGRNLTFTVEAGQTERQSTVASATFVDRRALLVLGYSTGPLFSPRSRR